GSSPDARGPDGSTQPQPDSRPGTPDAGGNGIPDGPIGGAALDINPKMHDFLGVGIDSTSSPFSFTVSNPGGAPTGTLVIIVTPPSFSLAGGTCLGVTLAPLATCTVDVTFGPTGNPGSRAGMVTVSASPGGSAVATLAGSAVPPAVLAVDPTGHDFG